MNMDTAYHGATRTRRCHIAHSGMMHWEWELLYGEDAPAAPASSVDEVLKKYAAEIDRMYVRRTRGDYSSIGILAAFMADLKKLEK